MTGPAEFAETEVTGAGAAQATPESVAPISTGETQGAQDAPQAAAPPAAAQPAAPSLDAFLRVRDEAKEAKREAAELRAWRAEQERKQQEAADEMPHPLEQPTEFAHWLRQRQDRAVQQTREELQGQITEDRLAVSREIMEDQLGDKFGELAKFIDSAPEEAHNFAMNQKHPYRWFWQQYQRAEKAKKAEAAAAALGDKSFEDVVAERIAAERAKWDAEHGGAAEEQPALNGQPRAPDGKFASSSQPQQRHQPPSLAVVTGAPAPRGGEARSGYDALFKRG